MTLKKPCSIRAFFLRFRLPNFERMAALRPIQFGLLFIAFCGMLPSIRAQSDEDLLRDAQAWQLRGKPEQSIRILEPLLPQLRDDTYRWKAQRQYAIALATSGSDSAALVHTQKLLIMNPAYRADAINDPPAFTRALQQFSVKPASAFHVHAGIGLGSARAYRTYSPALYYKTYNATTAFSLGAGMSRFFNNNITLETSLEYARSGFNYSFGLADWTGISVKERTDMLALPVALRLGSATFRGQSWFLRTGITPALTLDVRNEYARTFNGSTPAYSTLAGSRSMERRNAFQLALHGGIGWQKSTSNGRYGLQLAANYWQTPWVKESARFEATDITYAYFLYDDDLRRMDLTFQVFAERNIRWRVQKRSVGPGMSKPWELWLEAPSAVAGTEGETQLRQAENWLARGEFRRISDSVPVWMLQEQALSPNLLRLQMLAQFTLGDSLAIAAAIEKLLAQDPDYLRFPCSDPLPLQQRLNQYKILNRLEIGLQAGFLVPALQLVSYHAIAGANHTFRSIPGYSAGLLAGRQFNPNFRIQTGVQLIGFGYTAHTPDLNGWKQDYRENLQYAAIPLRFLLHVPGKAYGVHLGGQAACLTSANSEVLLQNTDGGISRNTLNNFPDRKPIQWSWTTGLFCRIPAGDGYLQLEGSWWQFSDIFNKPEERFSQPAQRLDYGFVDSDMRFGAIQLQCAFILPLSYQPKWYPSK